MSIPIPGLPEPLRLVIINHPCPTEHVPEQPTMAGQAMAGFWEHILTSAAALVAHKCFVGISQSYILYQYRNWLNNPYQNQE